MRMKFGIMAMMMVLAGGLTAGEASWGTDMAVARKAAGENGRNILLNFSGSDWCGWCIRLEKEVFSQAAFKTYADENLVLVVADFPRRTKLADDVVKRNESLAEKYEIEGFPTVLLLNAEGKVIGRTGYRPGGAEAYVKHLRELAGSAK